MYQPIDIVPNLFLKVIEILYSSSSKPFMHHCLEKAEQLMHNQLKLTPHNEKVNNKLKQYCCFTQ
jgi:hypothetical protein